MYILYIYILYIYIYIYIYIYPYCQPGYWQTTTQQILLPPPGTENLNRSPQQTKTPHSSDTLNLFNNNTYTNLKSARKHMLILQQCHAQELFGSQIPMTTGGFELM